MVAEEIIVSAAGYSVCLPLLVSCSHTKAQYSSIKGTLEENFRKFQLFNIFCFVIEQEASSSKDWKF